MGELLEFVGVFIGVTVMALITASTVRIVGEMLGPDGEQAIRETRERQDRLHANRLTDNQSKEG